MPSVETPVKLRPLLPWSILEHDNGPLSFTSVVVSRHDYGSLPVALPTQHGDLERQVWHDIQKVFLHWNVSRPDDTSELTALCRPHAQLWYNLAVLPGQEITARTKDGPQGSWKVSRGR